MSGGTSFLALNPIEAILSQPAIHLRGRLRIHGKLNAGAIADSLDTLRMVGSPARVDLGIRGWVGAGARTIVETFNVHDDVVSVEYITHCQTDAFRLFHSRLVTLTPYLLDYSENIFHTISVGEPTIAARYRLLQGSWERSMRYEMFRRVHDTFVGPALEPRRSAIERFTQHGTSEEEEGPTYNVPDL